MSHSPRGIGHRIFSFAMVFFTTMFILMGPSWFRGFVGTAEAAGSSKIVDASTGEEFSGNDPHVPCVPFRIVFTGYAANQSIDWELETTSPTSPESVVASGVEVVNGSGSGESDNIDLEALLQNANPAFSGHNQGYHINLDNPSGTDSGVGKTFWVLCQPGSITVVKHIDEDSDETAEFDFSADAPGTPNDGDFGPLGDNENEFFNGSGAYVITETVPAGWDNPEIDCGTATHTDNGDGSANVTVPTNDSVTCTFTNFESAPTTQCSDGVDNDEDGFIDFDGPGTADPQCDSLDDDTEDDPECSDNVDNDGDGDVDFDGGPGEADADPQCDDANDDSEDDPECSDNVDNDGDGGIDFDGPGDADPDRHCDGPDDDSESGGGGGGGGGGGPDECEDGKDNDGDGDVDYPDDDGCDSRNDDSEDSDGVDAAPTPTPTPSVTIPPALPGRPLRCAAAAKNLGLPLVVGTKGRDILVGTAADEVICAKAGNDVVRAGRGNDIVWAGAGNDLVRTGAGKDVVRGQRGNDNILTGSGNDTVTAGNGKDSVEGGSGNDRLYGQQHADSLNGGRGNDRVYGGRGSDTCGGGGGTDTVGGCEN